MATRLRLCYTSPYGCRDEKLTDYQEHGPTVLHFLLLWSRLSPVQQLLLVLSARRLPEVVVMNHEDPLPWYHLFFALDSDEDGKLSLNELVDGLRLMLGPKAGLTVEQLTVLARSLDLGAVGAVHWAEWAGMAALSLEGWASEPEPVMTAFRLLDRPSGDGALSIEDLQVLFERGRPDDPSMAERQTLARSLLRHWSTTGIPQEDQQAVRMSAVRDELLAATLYMLKRGSRQKGMPAFIGSRLRQGCSMVCCASRTSNAKGMSETPVEHLQIGSAT